MADHHATTVDQVFCANGSNEVLQSVLLAYGGAGRTAATFEPTYALHSHIARLTGTGVIAGERGERLHPRTATRSTAVLAQRPGVVFLCSPNNPTGLVADPELVASVADRCAAAGALLVVDEAYGQFASVVRAGSGRRRPAAASSPGPSPRPGRWPRLDWATCIGPAWVVDELLKVVLPYHLDAVTQLAGRLALDYVDEMDERVRLIVEERERLVAGLGRLPRAAVAVWGQLRPVPPGRGDGDAVWQGLRRPVRPGAQLFLVAPPRRTASGSPSAPRPRTTRS